MENDLFEFLERTHWPEIKPDQLVRYTGSMSWAHHEWLVVKQIGDNHYILRSLTDQWARISASREDIDPC